MQRWSFARFGAVSKRALPSLGNGIAIPHARIGGIDSPVVLFARTAKPIEFRASDRQPVHILYVMLVPSDGSTDEHLRRLAMVAQAFSDPALRNNLATLAEASSIRQAFLDADSRIQEQLQPGRNEAHAARKTTPGQNV